MISPRIAGILIRDLALAVILVLALLLLPALSKATATLDEQLMKAAAFADLELVKNLLDQGADVNAKPSDGWTPLMAAASGRYWRVVRVLPGMREEIALMPAFESGLSGRSDVAKLLLEKGAVANAKDVDGRTALMFASRLVEPHLVRALLDGGADVNAKAADGTTALMCAVENAGTDVMKLLLERGANVNARDQGGRTALMRAAKFRRGDFPDFSPLHRADVRTTFKQHDWMAYQEAVWKKRSDVVELLKAYGAEVTLIVAAMLGDTREVERLLDAGSDVNAKTADGLTAFIAAAELGHPDTVKVLLDRGADVKARALDGSTALMRAAQNGYVDVVKLLLEKGADVNAKAADGTTTLIRAAKGEDVDVVKLLLEKGAEVNARDRDGRTALWTAVSMLKTDFVELLLKYGADVNTRSKNGSTLLQAAKKQKDAKILELLEAHGRKK